MAPACSVPARTGNVSQCRRENDGVDDGRQRRDTRTVHGDDPGRPRRAGRLVLERREQLGVVVGDENADGQGPKHVEEQNTPEDTAHRLGDVLTRVLCLTSGDSYHLYATVREGGVDESGEEAEEAPDVARGRGVLRHRTWVLPVPEAQAVVCRSTTEIEHHGKDDESDDGEDLD